MGGDFERLLPCTSLFRVTLSTIPTPQLATGAPLVGCSERNSLCS